MEEEVRKGMRLGKYELGRTLGEGNFGKVKFAKDTVSGQSFAVKIIDKSRIADLNFSLQVSFFAFSDLISPFSDLFLFFKNRLLPCE